MQQVPSFKFAPEPGASLILRRPSSNQLVLPKLGTRQKGNFELCETHEQPRVVEYLSRMDDRRSLVHFQRALVVDMTEIRVLSWIPVLGRELGSKACFHYSLSSKPNQRSPHFFSISPCFFSTKCPNQKKYCRQSPRGECHSSAPRSLFPPALTTTRFSLLFQHFAPIGRRTPRF